VPVLRSVGAAVTARAPAKVNLYLEVGPLQEDGFHPVTTVYQAVSLVDDVTVTESAGLSVEVHGEGAADVPTDARNLAMQAAELLAAQVGVEPQVSLDLLKGIPVAGGMAGGSADAAATLVACDALWRTGLEREELVALGARIGSDVPFALHGGTALGTGRGEVLTPVLARGTYHWVLAFAHGGLSTPEVYAELDRKTRAPDRAGKVRAAGPDGVLTALRSHDPVALGAALRNDLQAPALRMMPALAKVLRAAQDLGTLGAVVSGSGPTVAMLCRDGEHALSAAAELSGMGVCRTVRRAHGPVPGARLVTD
jgi:4-diphosphocytidyl-2-C-methyl-D-erythritol kinase